ncbi:MAG: hypothetical protein ACOC56_05660 [Atribacterota bacterium]
MMFNFRFTDEFLESLKNTEYYNKEQDYYDLTKLIQRSLSILDLDEDLAHIAHEQWSGWMKYLFKKCTENPDGTVTIPKWAVDRWKRQMNTDYEDLPFQEQESDRIEARKYLEALNLLEKE